MFNWNWTEEVRYQVHVALQGGRVDTVPPSQRIAPTRTIAKNRAKTVPFRYVTHTMDESAMSFYGSEQAQVRGLLVEGALA